MKVLLRRAGPIAVSVMVIGFSLISAMAEDPVTGPPEGTGLTAIRSYANSGAFAGREEFDVAGEIGDGPGAILFIHELNRNTVPLMRGLDNLNNEFGIFGFKAFNVRLVADRTAGEEELLRVNGSLKLGNPIVLSLEGLDGPGNYALNRKCTLSLVMTKGGKVHRSVGYVDAGMADLPKMREMVEEVIGGLPVNEAALRERAEANLPETPEALRAQALQQAIDLHRFHREKGLEFETGPRYPGNRGNAMKGKGRMQGGKGEGTGGGAKPASTPSASPGKEIVRQGKPPEDGELNALLRSLIRKTNDDATTDAIFEEILARSVVSEALRGETVEMMKLMLSYPDRYGSAHAQAKARAFLEGAAKE